MEEKIDENEKQLNLSVRTSERVFEILQWYKRALRKEQGQAFTYSMCIEHLIELDQLRRAAEGKNIKSDDVKFYQFKK